MPTITFCIFRRGPRAPAHTQSLAITLQSLIYTNTFCSDTLYVHPDPDSYRALLEECMHLKLGHRIHTTRKIMSWPTADSHVKYVSVVVQQQLA